jgi:molecular chaperone HscC
MFGRFAATQVNPDEAVALGAAVQAGLKARDAALGEVVLTDVCPYTLGVDTAEHLPRGGLRENVFAPIIERNTVIPASRERSFSPISDRQRAVAFTIYQGESPDCRDNVELGKIEVPVPPGKAAETAVNVRFTYDINGLLEVDVVVPQTGLRRQLVLMDNELPMDADALAKRRDELAKLKVHPRDDDANVALIARATRCYEDSLGLQREQVAHWLSRFHSILESQDPRAIAQAREELSASLDAIDGQTFL